MIERQGGFDRLLVKGANVAENIDILTHAGWLRVLRDIATSCSTRVAWQPEK